MAVPFPLHGYGGVLTAGWRGRTPGALYGCASADNSDGSGGGGCSGCGGEGAGRDEGVSCLPTFPPPPRPPPPGTSLH